VALLEVRVDPNVVERIAKSLEELTMLLRAKLLADGYLAEPPEPKQTTPDDVRIVDGRSVWLRQQQAQEAQRRQSQLGG
jgi:hypothetical protein